MKRILLLAIAVMIAAVTLCACNDEYKIRFEQLSTESSENVTDDNSGADAKKIDFSIERPSESFLNSTKNYHSYKAEGENYTLLLYKTKTPINKIELFKTVKLEDGTITKGDVVYTLESLTTSKHLVASTLYGEQKMGICFFDSDGNFYAYEIDPIDKDSTAKIKLTEINLDPPENSQDISE